MGSRPSIEGPPARRAARLLIASGIALIAAVALTTAILVLEFRDQVPAAILAVAICLFVFLLVRELTRAIEQSRQGLEDQKRKLDAALEHMTQGLCMFDSNARLVLCNQRYLDMSGLAADTVVPGITVHELVKRRKEAGTFFGDPETYCSRLLTAIAGGGTARHLVEADDGRVIEVVNQPMAGGGWIATHNDITQQRRAEAEIITARAEAEAAERVARAAHARLLDAFEVVPEGLALFDAEDRYVLWNRRYSELYAAGAHIEVGARFEDVIRAGLAAEPYEGIRGREEEWVAERLARHRKLQSSHEQCLAGGRWVRVEERRTADGGSIGVRIDITELKQREASFRMLFEDNPLPMFVLDLESLRFLAVNETAVARYGYSREQFLAMTALDIRPEEDRERFLAALPTLKDYQARENVRHLRSDGTILEVDIYSRRLNYQGRPARFSVAIDTTERRRAERERDRNREFLHGVIENVPTTIFVRDVAENRYVLVNRAAEQLWGTSRESIIGRTPADLFSKSTADMIAGYDRVLLQTDTPSVVEEHTVQTPNNGTRTVKARRIGIRDAAGAPQYLLGVLEDVTESRAVEQQLRQAQKMEAVGNLTGGLAHDFNNLLTIIIGNLDLLQRDVAGNRAAEQKLNAILQAAERGADLTRQLLAFSRRQPLNPRRIEVNELITDTAQLLTRTLGETITVDLALGDELWPVVADAGQLEAALVNIAINARDAMPDGGVLALSSGTVHFDADDAARHPEAGAGDFVMIELRDSGCGMPADMLAHIFEPFFTTKAPGKGSGLGLSMVYGFIKQSGGHVAAESKVGEGTTFRLYLPRAREAEVRPPPRAALPRPAPSARRNVILAVDDNSALRATVAAQLRELGYLVLEADNAQSALDVLDGTQRIDLLFTDILMPGPIKGRELAAKARLKNPDLKVLFTSGFPGRPLADGVQPDENDMLLGKPYRRHELADAVYQVLQSGRWQKAS